MGKISELVFQRNAGAVVEETLEGNHTTSKTPPPFNIASGRWWCRRWGMKAFPGALLAILLSLSAGQVKGAAADRNNTSPHSSLTLVKMLPPIGLAGMAAVAIPNLIRARENAARTACFMNQQTIRVTTQQWAVDKKKPDNAAPTEDDLKGYFEGEQIPKCPAGGTYDLATVEKHPSCSRHGSYIDEEEGRDSPIIAYVTNGVDPFWDLCAAGVYIGEKEFNIKCEVHMPGPEGLADQQRIMEGLLSKNLDGIAISPIDADNQTGFLNDAAKRTMLITHDADAPKSNRMAYIGTDNYKAGRALGKLVKDAIPEGGEVMLFVGRLDLLNARQRRQGVIDELLDRPAQELNTLKTDPVDAKNLTAEGSKYIILDTRTDTFDKAKAKANAEDAMAKYENLACMVGLFAYNPTMCLDAIRNAGKLGRIKVCGFDEQDALLQAIKDGHAHGTISQQPWDYGYYSVKVLIAIMAGDTSIIPANKFIEVPFKMVTKNNVDNFWAKKKEMAELGKSSR